MRVWVSGYISSLSILTLCVAESFRRYQHSVEGVVGRALTVIPSHKPRVYTVPILAALLQGSLPVIRKPASVRYHLSN
jgi:hypothetical protein